MESVKFLHYHPGFYHHWSEFREIDRGSIYLSMHVLMTLYGRENVVLTDDIMIYAYKNSVFALGISKVGFRDPTLMQNRGKKQTKMTSQRKFSRIYARFLH